MKNRFVLYIIAIVLLGLVWFNRSTPASEMNYAPKIKAAMREVGDRLLREVGDSTSLIKPVKEVEHGRFHLTFENPLEMDPGWLVANTYSSFRIAGLPDSYIIQVIQDDDEVAYSYEMITGVDRTIQACGGRILPEHDYVIEANFDGLPVHTPDNPIYYLFTFFGVLVIGEYVSYQKRSTTGKETDSEYFTLGSFRFYPENHKLIKEATEIQLSRKETELLSILVARPNEVVKRDELTKRVWEDNGVIVGRSLDTYISKLRKKLQEDESIRITNLHGVGYKLELLS